MLFSCLPFKAALLGVAILLGSGAANADMRLKDLVEVDGQRTNQLVGYGVVVGLPGTGDDPQDSPFTGVSVASMLERLGVGGIDASAIQSSNAAAVIVTAEIPSVARVGSRIDVTVSALGDAESLDGGTLLVTPLSGADGAVYAVAQGPVSAGLAVAGEAEAVRSGSPTNGRVPQGALVEREIAFDFARQERVRLSLRNPDFSTADRVATAVRTTLDTPAVSVLDAGTVEIAVPEHYRGDVARMIARIENLRVDVDQPARVVIDRATGTIVIGEDVRISPVAVSQGGLTVTVTETSERDTLSTLINGVPVYVPGTDVDIDEEEGRFGFVDGASLRDLVDSLNALGVAPLDMIAILQAIERSGALHAHLEVM